MPSRLPFLPSGVTLGMDTVADDGGARFATGHAAIDSAFGGGLGLGRLHEIYGEAAPATGFAAMLALRARPDAPILWVSIEDAERSAGRFHAPGFAELGGDPRRLIVTRVRDTLALLRAAADATRCRGVGAVVAELSGAARAWDLTASRKLVLAAEASGVTLIVARSAAAPVPSAAETRWQASAAPSQPLEADAPGHPALDLTLLRRRAGPAGMGWRVMWDRDARAFAPLEVVRDRDQPLERAGAA